MAHEADRSEIPKIDGVEGNEGTTNRVSFNG